MTIGEIRTGCLWSVMMVDGAANRAIHPDTSTSACVIVSADMSLIGNASGQRVNLSTQVSRYM